MKTLVINTYGGSLLLGAKALGLEIIGSYEDTGFGSAIQAANFPEVNLIAMRRDWPNQDLSETFVIAHPPCSAFSVQNSNPKARGVDSAAFACTKSVLQYSVDNAALGIAIESVVGALQGAWPIHQYYADTYGYNVYRILENGTMFGAQWRDRFWVVYLKKGAAPDVMPWTLYPKFKTIRQVVGELTGPSPAGLDEELAKLKHRFKTEAGCTDGEIEAMFNYNVQEMESIDGLLWERKFNNEVRWDVCKRYVTKYASSAMVCLNPDGFCPVLLGSSWWHMDGRNMSEVGYKRLMGFPDDYVFPEGNTRKENYRADMRTYLSKGVMPPIAAWVLRNSLTHLGWKRSTVDGLPAELSGETLSANSSPSTVEPYIIECAPNQIADFRIRKKTWGEQRPALRHWDERRPTRTHEVLDHVEVPTTPRVPRAPKPIRVSGAPRVRSRTPWNSPEVEDSLRTTLFVRPNTADAYALHESHGYHRMGVRSGDVVLDIGAHIGCVASRAALVGAAKVISIEAEPENFELLSQNTRSFPNVELLYGAVYGGNTETVILNRIKKRDDTGHSTGTHSVLFRTQGDSIPVPRLDFHALVEKYQPTVIKCDVEGSEFSWNWANLPSCVRSVGIELHTRRDQNRDKAKEIVEVLEAQGFKPVHRLNMESNFSAIIAFFSREAMASSKEEPNASSDAATDESSSSVTVATVEPQTMSSLDERIS